MFDDHSLNPINDLREPFLLIRVVTPLCRESRFNAKLTPRCPLQLTDLEEDFEQGRRVARDECHPRRLGRGRLGV